MKTFVLILVAVLAFVKASGQTDERKPPVLNSVLMGEKLFNNFTLTSNYYTLKNNIDNKESSVYISEDLYLTDIEAAALKLPSDFFILTKDGKISVMILLQNDPEKEFVTVVMSSNEKTNYPAGLKGDITENRAKELMEEGYDSSAKIKNGVLTFNKRNYKIIPSKQIETAVLELIQKEGLDTLQPADIVMLSQRQLKQYILEETKAGGKLDFFSPIKGKESEGMQVMPGVYRTNYDIALYKWGRACAEIGVRSVEDTYLIFSKHKQKDLSQKEKDYIKLGFNRDLEK